MIIDRRVISGEMHYARIPRAYWLDRLRMARAMGLDAISTYVFWNLHEPRPGHFDFEGEKDVLAFVRLARQAELDVILRPGPYVCAEWDFGGLPAWLLANGEIAIRTTDERYMQPVRTWLARLGEELAPLQRRYGGPIVAVQLENEYGAFGADERYLRAMRAALESAGFDPPFYTIDQPKDLAPGALVEMPVAPTFGPGDPAAHFETLRALRADAPLVCGEYWAGWFDHWGEPHHRLDDEQQARDLEWMLAQDASVNIYMFHGGTNFGFWNGANSSGEHPYQPTTTSYDYDAALDEAGRPTPKYARFREIIERANGLPAPPVPRPPRTIEIAPFVLDRCVPVPALDLGEPVRSEVPLPMEAIGQSLGFVLYRAELHGPIAGTLEIEALRDYAVVMLDGAVAGHLDRRLGESRIALAGVSARSTLDILVENCGRINYGPDLPHERKGIAGAVRLNGEPVRDWQMYALPLEEPPSSGFTPGVADVPGFYRGAFVLDDPADTFLDVRDLGKGVLWINGRNAGRFWNVGPQVALYVPGVWLQEGRNEVVALDLFARSNPPRLHGEGGCAF